MCWVRHDKGAFALIIRPAVFCLFSSRSAWSLWRCALAMRVSFDSEKEGAVRTQKTSCSLDSRFKVWFSHNIYGLCVPRRRCRVVSLSLRLKRELELQEFSLVLTAPRMICAGLEKGAFASLVRPAVLFWSREAHGRPAAALPPREFP